MFWLVEIIDYTWQNDRESERESERENEVKNVTMLHDVISLKK